MSKAPNTSPWIAAVLKGEFDAIPPQFCWDMSTEFAHLINGYDVLGGPKAMETSHRMVCEIAGTGRTTASSLEIWAALFVQHRGYRMSGYGPGPEDQAALDRVCSVLRARLIRATGHEKIRILTVIAGAQEPLGGAAWRS